MPLLSAFTPLGMLRLSGAPSHAENIYRSLLAGYSKAFDVAEGSRKESQSYATAMALARVKYAAEHAAGQSLPDRIDVMLPVQERAYGLVPGPRDTLPQRRAAYASRRRVPKAPSRAMIESTLRERLGDALIAVVPTPIADAVLYPSFIGDPPTLLRSAGVTRKLVRLLDPVTVNADYSDPIRYESILESGVVDGSELLLVGDSLVVEPETLGITEPVTVTEVGVADDGLPTFVAFFESPHSIGALASQQNYPAWASTKRHTTIVLSVAAAVDATSRRKVDEFMSRAMRASSTWSIVGGFPPPLDTETGSFEIGVSPIGAQTIGSLAY